MCVCVCVCVYLCKGEGRPGNEDNKPTLLLFQVATSALPCWTDGGRIGCSFFFIPDASSSNIVYIPDSGKHFAKNMTILVTAKQTTKLNSVNIVTSISLPNLNLAYIYTAFWTKKAKINAHHITVFTTLSKRISLASTRVSNLSSTPTTPSVPPSLVGQ